MWRWVGGRPGLFGLDLAAQRRRTISRCQRRIVPGGPRDPFHRVDVLPSSRHVRLELDGHVLAESSRPVLLFETMLPTRYYLPPDDVRAELTPSSTRTWCAYKGQASYWSAAAGDRVVPDIGWTYQQPLHDAAQVRGLIAFFNERLDVIADGERPERPITLWSSGPGI